MGSTGSSIFRSIRILATLLGFVLPGTLLLHGEHASATVQNASSGFYRVHGEDNPTGTKALTGEASLFIPIVRRCEYLMFDDFSDSSGPWPDEDLGSVLFEYKNGEYRILMRNTENWAGAAPGMAFESYLISVDVRNINDVDGSYGLLFALSPWDSFFTFEVNSDENYIIWRYDGGDNWDILEIKSSEAIKPGTATNNLAIERNGSLLNAYINGEHVVSLTDDNHTGLRLVGVTATSWEESMLDVRFDNYSVLPIGCGMSMSSSAATENHLSSRTIFGDLVEPLFFTAPADR